MAIVYLSLGSNQGDRIGYIQQATALLNLTDNISIIRTSAFYETEPWNMLTMIIASRWLQKDWDEKTFMNGLSNNPTIK